MEKLGILEGLLFVVGDEGLTLDQISEILDINIEEATQLINQLKENYNQNDHGITINFLGNTYKLTTKKEHKEYYQKLIENPSTNILSNSALETLAIIAYNEPITRIKVDEIRGISSSQMIRKLVAKGLVKEIGKSDLPGRPNLYQTTNEFLDYFGLSSKEDLPKIENIEVEDDNETDLFLSRYKENI
jgi:segregation and condensation protein B